MSAALKDHVIATLRQIAAPGTGSDVVSAGMVSDVFVSDGRVMFSLTVPADRAKAFEPLRAEIEARVKALPGVERAMVALTAEVAPGSRAAAAPPARAPQQGHGHSHAHPHAHGGGQPQKPAVAGVKAIVAVASGKGGVGKSTTAVNLALGFSANGLKVGILDADIYGPSVPRLLKLSGRPEAIGGKTLKPMENYGLKVMSIGFLVDEETPMIWRGPMVVSAITQMLREVAWGELDVLVVDMPPGTGDAQLTMAQQVPLAGAVIVSTPQDLALIDARRGVAMFRKVEVPVLGIVENMSYFLCPHCGGRSDVFGHGGARHEAERIGVPFLGEVPLELKIRETSDAGLPVVATEPAGPHAAVYRAIAEKVWDEVAGPGAKRRPAPRIVIE
ncbi:Mrp/NBP35 family ATP-binding protein [Oharaeibacter diazotrophicus]|uniref:Iron-sulfur cluster carrier protein n=3 Tax=Oharaeibacter diazotrophicus TaxID=1920512 RepID=A0A4V3CWG0_9HYPH|nr:Mrp/NBP35 family ATP-binding protein [Oharaeibacter diazotrophicus]TDP86208.1 ATP-binding protein involved in chromosome partitioning [Oharaeibacter diazotrophicus]BBE71851.1 antiporter inner membrane protein [Pleomorphomonas sp. SM30]GLS78615.1 iron-sulfur cluster carrier protein [Oharaeibacter diazotrophicus]